ncbi:MAG: group II truncated hemoglobin [Bdellovibrio sp.]|nr:group II truncated hemoglobin [Bdellovibrio sp.]
MSDPLDQKPIYEVIGGEANLRKLVSQFYKNMDSLPEASDIRKQHLDLAAAEEKLYLFLSGWTGGPSLYIEKYGHPKLRARHLPFQIGIKERDQWLFCMFKAIEQTNIHPDAADILRKSLAHLADHMRNQVETT